jgi:two-component system chemotaxis sensor kinase CheA
VGGGEFFEQFIDEYFSECDEHLSVVRRVLLAIEQRHGTAQLSEIQELSRSLHTLKGLSGMVGLASAEQVAHSMEDVLRAVDMSAGVIADELLDALFAGATLIERCNAARRTGAGSPPTHEYVERVRQAIAREGRVQPPTATAAIVAGGGSSGGSSDVTERRFEFSPSAGLAARGVGVETVRARLQSLGDIVGVTPRVRPGAGVVFEFVVAMTADASPLESWRDDGLAWEEWTAPPASGGAMVQFTRPAEAPAIHSSPNVIRVDLTRLDDLMRMVGELVVSRARLDESITRAEANGSADPWEAVHESNAMIERQLRALREGVMRIRLVPVSEVFERMRFAMRDVVRDSMKFIRLEFTGQETEIDKLVVDHMLEPLLHLVRNAASHGIEDKALRIARGKPAEGTIALRARAAGDRIVLEVEDDGDGMDLERVTRRARDMGLVDEDDVVASDVLLDVICAPGFSTRDTADRTSGRGVGMAVVRSAVRALGGELLVSTRRGVGTRFTIELPLTLMIADALIVEVNGQPMAIPQLALREILLVEPPMITRLENNEVVSYRGGVLPLVRLRQLFNMPAVAGRNVHVLVVGNDGHLVGLVVDGLIGLREIVVHPVADPLVAVPGVSGATELADGRVSLILDATALARRTRAPSGRQPALAAGD